MREQHGRIHHAMVNHPQRLQIIVDGMSDDDGLIGTQRHHKLLGVLQRELNVFQILRADAVDPGAVVADGPFGFDEGVDEDFGGTIGVDYGETAEGLRVEGLGEGVAGFAHFAVDGDGGGDGGGGGGAPRSVGAGGDPSGGGGGGEGVGVGVVGVGAGGDDGFGPETVLGRRSGKGRRGREMGRFVLRGGRAGCRSGRRWCCCSYCCWSGKGKRGSGQLEIAKGRNSGGGCGFGVGRFGFLCGGWDGGGDWFFGRGFGGWGCHETLEVHDSGGGIAGGVGGRSEIEDIFSGGERLFAFLFLLLGLLLLLWLGGCCSCFGSFCGGS
mmetsp:Transcript_24478/g.50065  ORF Transcript_24478/g.50065 Transcript_24478/m.50065 type:complete len:325 (-) Transcript_24478:264-1238(-)